MDMEFDHILDDTEFTFQVIYEDDTNGQIGIFHHKQKIGLINYRFLSRTPLFLYITKVIREDDYHHQSIGYRLLHQLIRHITRKHPEITILLLNSEKYLGLWKTYGFREETHCIESIDQESQYITSLAYHIQKV